MANVVISKSDFTIQVNKTGGRLIATGPMTVKNQIQEIRTFDMLPGINAAAREDGATLIYNANTGVYDVKLYNNDNYLQVTNLHITRVFANNSLGTNGQVLFTNGNTTYWANGVTKVIAGAGLSGGGQGEDVLLSVNTAFIATITSNNATFAYGKREQDLTVNFSQFSANANFAYVANQAVYATNAEFSYTSNNSAFAYGKREQDLSVNFSQYSSNANYSFIANSANYLNGLGEAYYTNATNLSTGTLNQLRLPNTAVTPGTYGNTSQIPVVTVDQYGRINAISTSTISSLQDLTITGNLTVTGTTTTIDAQNLSVNDAIITLNSGQITPLNDIGILLQRFASANSTNYNVAIAWDEDSQQLKIGKAPQDGSTNEVSFSSEWIRFDENGNAYIQLSIEAGNNVKAANTLIINNVSITETSYPGTANAALYFNGIIDCGTY